MAATVKEMDGSLGFDVVVVCTSNAAQEQYWQERLEATRGQAAKKDAVIVAVHEDWGADGAGNGLGTLYAYTKARAKASDAGSDLDAILASGGTVGIYHTAGKGTRLAPLPGAENNNKPGVKLPATAPLGVDGAVVPLTILESVVKSTGIYASSRKGRLSVFWGDQVFVPTKSYEYDAKRAHADILCMLAPMPSASEWAAKGLEKYGLVAVAKNGFEAASYRVPGSRRWRLRGSTSNSKGRSDFRGRRGGPGPGATSRRLWHHLHRRRGPRSGLPRRPGCRTTSLYRLLRRHTRAARRSGVPGPRTSKAGGLLSKSLLRRRFHIHPTLSGRRSGLGVVRRRRSRRTPHPLKAARGPLRCLR